MTDERTHVTLFEFVRWLVPTALVLLGVIFFFAYVHAAPAIVAAGATP